MKITLRITTIVFVLCVYTILAYAQTNPASSSSTTESKPDGPTQRTMPELPKTGAPLKSITIHQEVDFQASPKRVYEALLDTKQFSAFSARPAEINHEVGGAFSLFGGHIVGRNLEFVRNKRIVQAWRVVTWPEGVYSIVKFELKAQGAGTHLVFDHAGFPEDQRDHLAEGWESNYWALLKNYLR